MRRASDLETDAEWRVLTSASGRALLTEVAQVAHPGPSDLARWRGLASAEQVSAALRVVEARRRAASKFTRASAMWFERTGLEQASAEAVARHKAARFAGVELAVDLCCGIGGDTLALGEVARTVLAVDRDVGMLRRTRWNTEAYGVSDRVLPVCCRAETFAIPEPALIHIDPDRRAGMSATRALRLADYAPGLAVLDRLMRTASGGALKLGPASDFDAHFRRPGLEIELISLDGECKEATVWFGVLASCERRATCLRGADPATWTERDGPSRMPFPRPSPELVGRWVFDPDPSLVRSGLLDPFAAAHDLRRVAPGIDWLTGSERVRSPFLSAFEVEAVWPLDRKRLRRLVTDRGLGPLEIKVRGLDLRPETLRAQLKPPGPNAASLLLVGGRGPARALLARRQEA